jgi:predicted ATPase/transcriptional regulator with XRE-family HTH domain
VKEGGPGPFGAKLKSLREAAGFTQEELATIAGLSVHAVSALERGQRRRPHPETVRSLAIALDLPASVRDELVQMARGAAGRDESDAADTGLLPQVLTPLIGREGDVRVLQGWLASPPVRIVTLVGPGGVGKTRLALEIAREAAAAPGMRVVFVGLASIRESSFVAPAIAEAFGVTDVTLGDLPRRVRAACAGRSTLLVLDNFEHVLDAVPLVATLLSEVASLRVLATSRAPLRVRGEREYAVGPLAMEAPHRHAHSGEPALAPAVRLFVDRVHDFDGAFRLTDANASVVAAICQRLDALPLAIELAAPWLKTLPPHELLSRLHRDALAQGIGRRDLPERQQTMNATVAWSYRLLAPDEQQVFRRLAALPSRFPMAAAEAVCSPATADDTTRLVAGLIDRSLLLRADGSPASGPLYLMLETVRAYALAELTASGERDAAMEGLARYCVATSATAEEKLLGRTQAEWLDRVRDDLESFRSGMRWLIDHDRPSDACAIVWRLLFFWLIRGHTAEGLGWYDRLLALPSLTAAERAMALAGAAVMRYAQGDLHGARQAATLAVATSNDNSMAAALGMNILGHVGIAVGDLAAARDNFTAVVDRFGALGVPWMTGNAMAGLASVSLATGDVEETSRLLADARAAMSGIGPWFSEIALYVQAVLSVRRGRPREAIAVVRESLLHIQRLHDRFALVYSLVPLAAAAELIGDDAWAARILAARDAVTERTGAIPVDDSVRDLRERVERDARARLGQRRWAREYEAGRKASVESLLGEIDERSATTATEANSVTAPADRT